MFTHVDHHEEAAGSPVQGALFVLLVLAIAGVVVVYARTVALFLRVFVRVFLDEVRAQPATKPRARPKPQATA